MGTQRVSSTVFLYLVLSLIAEIFFLILYILAGLIGYIFKLSFVNKIATKPYPIVFVHGWFTQNPLYYFLKRYLEDQGFSVYMTNFGLQLGDFEEQVIKLQKFINDNQLNNVILVGVSGGAITSYSYLQQHDGWKKVRKYISIGGPHKGAPLALIAAFFSKAARQMLPNSQYLTSLNDKLIRNADKIVCISARYDFIVPPSSSHMSQTNNQTVNVLGHVKLQAFSQEVYRIIAKEADK